MGRWEYTKAIYGTTVGERPMLEYLNAMGRDGWEVCGYSTDGVSANVLFKRLVVEPPSRVAVISGLHPVLPRPWSVEHVASAAAPCYWAVAAGTAKADDVDTRTT